MLVNKLFLISSPSINGGILGRKLMLQWKQDKNLIESGKIGNESK
jgi:hypothetical protein